MKRRRTTRESFVDYAIYLSIGTLVVAVLLALHVLAFAFVIGHGVEIRARPGGLVLALEVILIDAALVRIGIRPRRAVRRASTDNRRAPAQDPQ